MNIRRRFNIMERYPTFSRAPVALHGRDIGFAGRARAPVLGAAALRRAWLALAENGRLTGERERGGTCFAICTHVDRSIHVSKYTTRIFTPEIKHARRAG
jgi:hypothetical protein